MWLGKAQLFPVTCHFPTRLRDETLAWASFKSPVLPGIKPLASHLQAMGPKARLEAAVMKILYRFSPSLNFSFE